MKTKIAVVISDFNEEITSKMEKNAEKAVASLNAEIIKSKTIGTARKYSAIIF